MANRHQKRASQAAATPITTEGLVEQLKGMPLTPEEARLAGEFVDRLLDAWAAYKAAQKTLLPRYGERCVLPFFAKAYQLGGDKMAARGINGENIRAFWNGVCQNGASRNNLVSQLDLLERNRGN